MKVTGIITGDCECWCLQVTEEEYRRIVGEETYKLDKKLRKEYAESDDPFIQVMANEPWLIYPNDLMEAIGLEYSKTPVSFEINAL